MSRRPSLTALERRFLAELPPGTVDPARVPEFTESFGSAVFEAADMAALLVGTIPPTELTAAVGRMARIVVDAIDTGADELDVGGHPWIAEAQGWAVGAFFARLAEVSRAAPQGGRA